MWNGIKSVLGVRHSLKHEMLPSTNHIVIDTRLSVQWRWITTLLSIYMIHPNGTITNASIHMAEERPFLTSCHDEVSMNFDKLDYIQRSWWFGGRGRGRGEVGGGRRRRVFFSTTSDILLLHHSNALSTLWRCHRTPTPPVPCFLRVDFP